MEKKPYKSKNKILLEELIKNKYFLIFSEYDKCFFKYLKNKIKKSNYENKLIYLSKLVDLAYLLEIQPTVKGEDIIDFDKYILNYPIILKFFHLCLHDIKLKR